MSYPFVVMVHRARVAYTFVGKSKTKSNVIGMLLNLILKDWLSFSVLGTLVTAIGSLLGFFIKDYLFSRSFELWKQRQTLAQLRQKYRDPLVLSACELASRISEVLDHYPTVYLRSDVFKETPAKQVTNSVGDPYFQRYKLLSTAYRLTAFLAWLELYRQNLTFLRHCGNGRACELDVAVDLIRQDLADGQINTADDWDGWRDSLVFREEMRAIGESMIEVRGSSRTVMGYGQYCECLDASASNATQRWSAVVLNFLLDLESHGRDFRHIRLKRLLVHLVDLASLMDSTSVQPHLREASRRLRAELT